MPGLAVIAVSAGLFGYCVASDVGDSLFDVGTAGWWAFTSALHVPFFLMLCFIAGGLVERVGFYWRGRAPEPGGQLPDVYPTVCVQLPMFNEHAVAERVIEAAAAMSWPKDRFSVQVLDDSTDDDTRRLVERVCDRVRASTGVDCYVLNRVERQGYKAGALEAGRRQTAAEFLAILDADFVPPPDFLLRAMPHFYLPSGRPDAGLALVQAQWGHLNHNESRLTLAQSLWVDDHHTLQMSWRSAAWRFVNFTGTAGIWRASAIEAAGGWRAASLVEDCELSFRALFAGFRTKFVKEIVVPAELPATYAAYKAQQRRWTRGWIQLHRLHLATLLLRYRATLGRRIHLLYHMCITWQWPALALWINLLPFLIYTDHWFGSFGLAAGVGLYVLPTALWVLVVATVTSLETKHTYAGRITPATFLERFGRIVPHIAVNTGMLPHQFCAAAEGLFGPMHGEFERTPKAASVTTHAPGLVRPATAITTPAAVKVHGPYVVADWFFAACQFGWAVLFAANGVVLCAVGALYVASCILFVGWSSRGREITAKLGLSFRRA